MINATRSAILTNYADVARQVGLDPQRMLREFGLPRRCLEEPELKVPADAVRQLLETSAERSGVEGLGLLMMDEARQLLNLGPLGLLIREQPTLRLAARRSSATGGASTNLCSLRSRTAAKSLSFARS